MPNDLVIAEQYRRAFSDGGIDVSRERSLIQVAGADRAAWLNNLLTNDIAALRPGFGCYAFAADVRGRTVFDLNVLGLEDCFWLDLDSRFADAAKKHLRRYVLTEDISLTDLTQRTRRIAVLGPRIGGVAAGLSLPGPVSWIQLQHLDVPLPDAQARMVRHDFAGLSAVEFIITASDVGRLAGLDFQSAVTAAAAAAGLAQIDRAVVDILRIEAGIPVSVDDIDEDVIPPETGQAERGINHHKGCYLGQEVIERMRSRGVLARRLVGVRVDGDELVSPRSAVLAAGVQVGQTRSCCWSEALGAVLALAYVKTARSAPGEAVAVASGGSLRPAAVVPLPVSR